MYPERRNSDHKIENLGIIAEMSLHLSPSRLSISLCLAVSADNVNGAYLSSPCGKYVFPMKINKPAIFYTNFRLLGAGVAPFSLLQPFLAQLRSLSKDSYVSSNNAILTTQSTNIYQMSNTCQILNKCLSWLNHTKREDLNSMALRANKKAAFDPSWWQEPPCSHERSQPQTITQQGQQRRRGGGHRALGRRRGQLGERKERKAGSLETFLTHLISQPWRLPYLKASSYVRQFISLLIKPILPGETESPQKEMRKGNEGNVIKC